jgi:long-chain fatty acid transport protein
MRIFVLLTVLLFPAAALAGGYAIPNETARDLALSQATVAAQNGPGAAYQNSAALAGQKGLGFSGSLELLFNNTTWTDPNLGTASIGTHVNTPPSIAIAYGGAFPNAMNYGLGFSYNVPGGGSLFWPYNWAGATRIQSVKQRVHDFKMSGGIELLEGIKIGAGVSYYRIDEDLVQQVNYVSTFGNAELGVAGGAFSYSLAGEFRIPGVPLVLGVDYAHKADIKLSGNAHFNNVPPQFQSVLQDQGATERVTVPNFLFIGLAYTIMDGLQVMASWNLERWSVYKSDTYIGDRGFVVSVPRNYNDAYVYRLGIEYAHVPFLKELTLRLGGLRSVSSQPTDTLSPSLTDADSWAVSVGAGYDILSNLRADIGYQHGFFDSVMASGPEAFPGSYKTNADLISFGLIYRTDL